MFRFIILLYVLSFSSVYASEEIHFLNKPDYLTNTEAMIAIGHAAKNRKYNVPSVIGDTLRITLNHKGYNVDLEFSVSGDNIIYKDSTTGMSYDDDDSGSKTQGNKKPAPAGWINNLRNNAENFFLLIKNIKNNQSK